MNGRLHKIRGDIEIGANCNLLRGGGEEELHKIDKRASSRYDGWQWNGEGSGEGQYCPQGLFVFLNTFLTIFEIL